MNPRRFPVALALLLALAFLAVGCGDTTVDSAKTEDTTQASLEKSLHEKIASVECPSGQKVIAGATFTCSVDFSDGGQGIVTLKIRNSEADLSVVGLKTN